MEIKQGTITDITQQGITIKVSYDNIDRLIKRKYETCLVGFNDGRKASDKQLRTIYAFFGAIADWSGYDKDETKDLMKITFRKNDDGLEKGIFSLADCDMTLAREFTKFLIKFLCQHDIPVFIGGKQISILDFINDDKDLVAHQVWACLKYKRCVICGGASEVHHTPVIGMGYDRTEIVHEGMTAQPLCRGHHTEAHTKGQKEFDKLYHLTSIVLDKELCKVYDLKTKGVEK